MIWKVLEQPARCLLGFALFSAGEMVLEERLMSDQLMRVQFQALAEAFLGGGHERFGPIGRISEKRRQMAEQYFIRNAGCVLSHPPSDQGAAMRGNRFRPG